MTLTSPATGGTSATLPVLSYTLEIARQTAPIYDRMRSVLPEIESSGTRSAMPSCWHTTTRRPRSSTVSPI